MKAVVAVFVCCLAIGACDAPLGPTKTQLNGVRSDQIDDFHIGDPHYDYFTGQYGNWCGPGWSGGRADGTIGDGTPVDLLDEKCRTHDLNYHSADLRWGPQFEIAAKKEQTEICKRWGNSFDLADDLLAASAATLPSLGQSVPGDAPDAWGYDPRKAWGAHPKPTSWRMAYAGAVQQFFKKGHIVSLYSRPECNWNLNSIEILPGNLQLEVGQAFQLHTLMLTKDKTVLTYRDVSWSSTAPTVASVDGMGNITALGVGTTIISAESEKKLAIVTVTVKPPSIPRVPGSNLDLSGSKRICIMSKYLPQVAASYTWSVALTKNGVGSSGTTLLSYSDQNIFSCEYHQGSYDLSSYNLAAGDKVYLKVTSPDNQSVVAEWTWDGTKAVAANAAPESVVAIETGVYIQGNLLLIGADLFYFQVPQYYNGFEQTLNRVSINGGTPSQLASHLPPVQSMTTDGSYIYWGEQYSGASGAIRRIPLGGGPVETLATGLQQLTSTLVFYGGFVYFSSYVSGDPPTQWRIQRLSVSSGATSDVVRTAIYPGFTVAGGILYYEDQNPATACQTFPSTPGAISKIPVGGGTPTAVASGVTFNCGGTKMVVNNGVLYVSNGPNADAISSVPIAGGALTPRVTGLSGVTSMLVDGSNLYVNANSSIARYDLATFAKTPLSWWRSASGMAVSGTAIYWGGHYQALDNCCGGAPVASLVRATK